MRSRRGQLREAAELGGRRLRGCHPHFCSGGETRKGGGAQEAGCAVQAAVAGRALPVSSAGASHGCAAGRRRPGTGSPGLPGADTGRTRASFGGSFLDSRAGAHVHPPTRSPAETLPTAKYANSTLWGNRRLDRFPGPNSRPGTVSPQETNGEGISPSYRRRKRLRERGHDLAKVTLQQRQTPVFLPCPVLCWFPAPGLFLREADQDLNDKAPALNLHGCPMLRREHLAPEEAT